LNKLTISDFFDYLSPSILKIILENTQDGICAVNREREIFFWNKGAEKISGYSQEEVLGRKCWDQVLVHVNAYGTKLCDELCPALKVMEDGQPRHLEVYIHHKEGYLLPVAIHMLPLTDEKGKIKGAAEIFADMSPKVLMPQKTEELRRMALLDPLTEVGNQRYLEIQLISRLEELRKFKLTSGVLYLDIDKMININEAFGASGGDKVLRTVGQTLQNNIRFFDIVGRWKEDEFIVVILNITEPKLDMIANKLRLLVAQASLLVENEVISTSVSVGATLAHKNDSVDSLINRAQKLMTHAKWLGRNRVAFTLELPRK
jgi:diguanylate cyclase (GGDEF)-like protein/PAS domain S-box-containing protein